MKDCEDNVRTTVERENDLTYARLSWMDGKKEQRTRFVGVLEIPPVESAETAVRVQIVKDFRKGKK